MNESSFLSEMAERKENIEGSTGAKGKREGADQNMKKWKKNVLRAGAVVLVGGILLGIKLYGTRIKTIETLEQLTDYEDYNLYQMDVKYAYDLDRILAEHITDDQSFVDAVLKEALPHLPVHIKVPDFGCSAFTANGADGTVRMGRNYDFRYDTSALMVHCHPKNGYESIAFAALDNIQANDATRNLKTKASCLLAPFVCLDGLNEKGVSIAVLTLDSEPTRQETGKEKLPTTLAIRLVLDQAATTQEAVDLLKEYDMLATSGRDYHFYITDASGDGRVVEYDCETPDRKLVATPSVAVTNFFIKYEEKVLPNQRNGIYGHGRERYDRIMTVLEESQGNQTKETTWDALKTAAQEPNPEEVTSNTQWSIVYNNTDRTAEIALRRKWEDTTEFTVLGMWKE